MKKKEKIFENHTEQWFNHFCFLAVKAIVFSLNNFPPVMWTSEPKPTAGLYTHFYSRANYGLEPQTGETLHWNDHRKVRVCLWATGQLHTHQTYTHTHTSFSFCRYLNQPKSTETFKVMVSTRGLCITLFCLSFQLVWISILSNVFSCW